MLRFIIVSTLVGCTLAIGRTQSISAKGILICDGKPAAGVKVKLYDEDSAIFPLPNKDDLMDSTSTDHEGRFVVSGHTDEFTPIDPKINIYHDCNDKALGVEKPCQRKFTVYLPKSYISSGKTPTKDYDAGTIQLSGTFPKESRDCAH